MNLFSFNLSQIDLRIKTTFKSIIKLLNWRPGGLLQCMPNNKLNRFAVVQDHYIEYRLSGLMSFPHMKDRG